METPTDDELFKAVQKAVAETLRIPFEKVTRDSLLFHELGAESLDFVDIEFRLESEFGVEFYHGSAVERLAELFAPQALEVNGLLTPCGAVVLRARMPEVDPLRLQEGKAAAGIESMFTTRTWMRVARELLSARPQACSQCGSDRLKLLRPSVLLCFACAAEVQCPTGEDILIGWAKNVNAQVLELQKQES
jgi:acyl carrier protein